MGRMASSTKQDVMKVLRTITKNPNLSRGEIATKTKLDIDVVGTILRNLRGHGEVKTKGTHRWTTYTLARKRTTATQ